MKNFTKKSLSVLLALMLLLCYFSCLAAAAATLNEEAVNAHYGQYENYVLLGDSVASGYRDIITENDRQFNVDT